MIEIKGLSKIYKDGKKEVVAIDDINLTINDGDIFGIIGLSGAGKSTLVRSINMLEKPTRGEILIDGLDITKAKPKELRSMRQNIGMIFQGFNLLEQKTVLKNVMFPLEIKKVKKDEAIKRAVELLKEVGLYEKKDSYPSTLSGGEKQRVAIARALALNPKILLSDEATSALDPDTTQTILSLLKEINLKYHITIVIITHEMKVINQICNRVAVIKKSHIGEIDNVNSVFKDDEVNYLNKKSNEFKNVKVFFDNSLAYKPVIANLILSTKSLINIMSADINEVDGIIKGQMLINVPAQELRLVLKYLSDENIKYEVIENGIF